jgi:hypothetical protein
MADSKITDLNPMTAGVLARTVDVVPIVDVSETEDKKVTIQQLMDDAPVTGSNPGSMSVADKTKLDGVATGATANSSDATLLNRANHTGTQTASTISDFDEAAQDAVGTILTDTATVDFTYNDAGNTISAIVIDNSISDAKLRTGTARSVIGRSAATNGNVADIVAGADGQFLGRSSGTLSFAVPPTFTSGAAGYAPASGGGTTNFLRADGTWAAPSGGGGGDNITINGVAATDANFNDTTPVTPLDAVTVKWLKDSATPNNVSAFVPFDIEYHRAMRLSAFYHAEFTGNSAPFSNSAVSSGTVAQAASGTVTTKDHPGVVRFTSSTTANSGYRIGTDLVSYRLGGGEAFSCVWRHETFTNTTCRIGFHDCSTSADAVDGCYIEVDTSGVASAKTASNSSRTTNATTVTLSTGTWYNCDIFLNSAGTLVDFIIRNDAGTVLLNVNNTTNIPTGSGRECGAVAIATNSGTTATLLFSLDYMSVSFITARTR